MALVNSFGLHSYCGGPNQLQYWRHAVLEGVVSGELTDFGIAGPSVMVGFNRGWQVRRVASWMGVAEPTRRRSWLWWRSEVVACLSVVAACSGPPRLALLGNGQCGVGLRRRTALMVSASWDDLACNGP
jgi:hypothetical protein